MFVTLIYIHFCTNVFLGCFSNISNIIIIAYQFVTAAITVINSADESRAEERILFAEKTWLEVRPTPRVCALQVH